MKLENQTLQTAIAKLERKLVKDTTNSELKLLQTDYKRQETLFKSQLKLKDDHIKILEKDKAELLTRVKKLESKLSLQEKDFRIISKTERLETIKQQGKLKLYSAKQSDRLKEKKEKEDLKKNR